MKTELKKIIAGIGLEELKFGSTREQVKAILGEPDATEKSPNSELENDMSESWHYDGLELSMTFDQEEDWRLVTFAITSEAYKFQDVSLIGLSKDDLLVALEKLEVSDLELDEDDEDAEDDASFEMYSSEDLGIIFWVEEGKVTEVQWGILFLDEDTISWPQ